MKKLAKAVTAVLAVGALGTLVFMRMTKKEEPMEAVPDPSVQVENPAADTISISTDLTGTVEPADVVYVAAMGSGEVLEVYVNQGEMVEKDQTLFKIDNKQLESARIQLNTAKVSLDDAQTNLNRMKVLYDSGDISAQAYEQVVNGVSMAKLQYDGAKLNYDIQMENSTVTAPISGLLESFDIKVHDMMAAGSVAAVISGAGNKSVAFSVSERVREGLHPGDAMTVEKNGTEYNGVITEIGTMVDQQTGLFKIKASLEGADALATGTVVKLSVISEKAENVMTVPVDCVSYSGGQAYVYTYDQAAGAARKVAIEDGLIGSERIQVLSGLDYSDQVITTWTKELYEGAPVQLADGSGTDAETSLDGGESAHDRRSRGTGSRCSSRRCRGIGAGGRRDIRRRDISKRSVRRHRYGFDKTGIKAAGHNGPGCAVPHRLRSFLCIFLEAGAYAGNGDAHAGGQRRLSGSQSRGCGGAGHKAHRG